MLIPFNELFARHQIQTPGVLHLGANTGQEAEAYFQQNINRVVWVEAMPNLYSALVRHLLKVVPHADQLALCACVGDVDGEEVTFHVANNSGQSSSYLELGTHLQHHPTVRYVQNIPMRTKRVDTLLREHNVGIGDDWFLNADLQGAELKALRGMGDLLWKFKYAYIEVNDEQVYKGCPHVREIDDYLALFGLLPREVKMTGCHWGDKFYQRN